MKYQAKVIQLFTPQPEASNVSDEDLDNLYDLFCDWFIDDGSNDKYFSGKIKVLLVKWLREQQGDGMPHRLTAENVEKCKPIEQPKAEEEFKSDKDILLDWLLEVYGSEFAILADWSPKKVLNFAKHYHSYKLSNIKKEIENIIKLDKNLIEPRLIELLKELP